ncbi:MAG: hypothetical protein OXN44_00310 [Acidimicrobiaceae bacterium]|nr:hypothetical protein [Acidimicrobiaceae bacterium]
MATLFTYVVRWDIGFAPNPYFGFCTLATCKPKIRKLAAPGDWIAGIGSKQNETHGRLVYTMCVEETLSFDEYWADPRFARKKPNRIGSVKQRYGDNIYHRAADGRTWIQEDGRHSLEDGKPNLDHVKKDTNGQRVLISRSFAYFGADAIEIPSEFRDWKGKGYFNSVRDFRRNFPDDLRVAFTSWLNSLADVGIAGKPFHWS